VLVEKDFRSGNSPNKAKVKSKKAKERKIKMV
jgi:hypothetical protein